MRLWAPISPVLFVLAACQAQKASDQCSENVTVDQKNRLISLVWPKAKRIEASSDPDYDLAKHLDHYDMHFLNCNQSFRVVFSPIQNEDVVIVGWKSTFVVDRNESSILDYYQE